MARQWGSTFCCFLSYSFITAVKRTASLPLAVTPSLSSQIPKLQELATWNVGQLHCFPLSRKFCTCVSQIPQASSKTLAADQKSLLFRAAFSQLSTNTCEGVGKSDSNYLFLIFLLPDGYLIYVIVGWVISATEWDRLDRKWLAAFPTGLCFNLVVER